MSYKAWEHGPFCNRCVSGISPEDFARAEEFFKRVDKAHETLGPVGALRTAAQVMDELRSFEPL